MNEIMSTQDQIQSQDINAMFFIFAALVCILPIYYGFKKSFGYGLAASGCVAGTLTLYFTIPAAQTIITIGFCIFVVVGLVIHTKDVIFP